jgi:hypothetical protein
MSSILILLFLVLYGESDHRSTPDGFSKHASCGFQAAMSQPKEPTPRTCLLCFLHTGYSTVGIAIFNSVYNQMCESDVDGTLEQQYNDPDEVGCPATGSCVGSSCWVYAWRFAAGISIWC